MIVATLFTLVSISVSIWTLVMVLPFEIPVLSKVCFYINGKVRSKYYLQRMYKQFEYDYDPDND